MKQYKQNIDQLRDHLDNRLWNQLDYKLNNQLRNQLLDQLCYKLRNQLNNQLRKIT
jgi:FKBP-type peptidyl-prolyl cis-trans isomerase (trigger factor)